MLPTLTDGSFLIGYRLSKSYECGDIVAIDMPYNRNYIKRVIGTPGDTVTIDYSDSTVRVNGILLDEPYINEPMISATVSVPVEYYVDEGCYFVMGDNRNYSNDSRNSSIGLIVEDQIICKMLFRVF